MKKLITLLFVMMISFTSYSQPPDCTGQGIEIELPSLIPNAGFEDHSCEPTIYSTPSNSNLDCLDNWSQAGTVTVISTLKKKYKL